MSQESMSESVVENSVSDEGSEESVIVNEVEESKYDRAAKAMADVDISFMADTDEFGIPVDPSQEEALDESGEVDETEEETEEEAEEEAEPPGWKYAQLRKKETAVREEQIRAGNMVLRAEKMQEHLQNSIGEVDRLKELARTQPEKFMEAMGLDPVQVYHRWTAQNLGEDFDEPQDSAALKKIQEIERRLEERDSQLKEAREAQARAQAERNFQTAVAKYTEIGASIPNNEQLKTQFPSLSELPEAIRRQKVRECVSYFIVEHPETRFEEAMKFLDDHVAEELKHYKTLYGGSQERTQPSNQESVGRGSASKKTSSSSARRKSLTNQDQSESSGEVREMSKAERYRRAGAAIPDSLFDNSSF
jgi:hypothetical protein